MKITKYVHSCLVVEMPDGRTAVFDPGGFSTLDPANLTRVDDIFITHNHGDHLDAELIKKLVAKFPDARICTTAQGVEDLAAAGITAGTSPPEGAALFDSPHESTEPLFPTPQEVGVHFMDQLTHPGDCHHFSETRAILALPLIAPWGAPIPAFRLAAELKPRYVVPIHDWHLNDKARAALYDMLEGKFAEQGITFIKTVDGQPFTLDV